MKYSLQWDPVRDQIHHYCELTSYQCETTLWIQCLLANVLCVFMCRDPLHLTLMMNYIYCHYQLFLSNISTINFLLHLTPVSKYEEFQNKLLYVPEISVFMSSVMSFTHLFQKWPFWAVVSSDIVFMCETSQCWQSYVATILPSPFLLLFVNLYRRVLTI